MSNAKKSVINRGQRIYKLRPHEDGTARELAPGKTIECIDDVEFKLLSGYHDIGDVDKLAPQLAQREAKLREELAKVKKENAKLVADAERNASDAPVEETPAVEPVPVPEEEREPEKVPAYVVEKHKVKRK